MFQLNFSPKSKFTPLYYKESIMKRLFCALVFSIVLIISTLPQTWALTLDQQIQKALTFSEIQLEKHAKRSGPKRFTCYTNLDGKWEDRYFWGWCCGFSAGLMWMMFDHTGEEKWADYGRDWNDSIRPNATASDNDTGFQIFNSFGYALRHGKKVEPILNKQFDGWYDILVRDYVGVMNWATNTFVTQRYNAHIGGFRTWPALSHLPYEGEFEINSDMIMNLELPLWVVQQTGNMDLLDKIIRHEETTWRHTIFKKGDEQWETPKSDEFVKRQHGSHTHVVGFDPKTGSVVNKRTEQGDKTESTWSRGQSWLIYGYAMLYRYTGYDRYLERAEIVFDYYMNALRAQSKDSIPYSDFDAPVDERNPLDTSAAAVVASASIELYEFTKKQKYLDAAEEILTDLTASPYLAINTEYDSILTRGSHSYDRGQEVGTIFGDFYLVEAMLRYLKLKQ